jgi:transposase
MRRLDAPIRKSQKKLAVAVKASGTSLTDLFGTGPFTAATVIGDAADVARFATRDHCRVAPVHCCTGAPSGPRMHVPAHAAQASRWGGSGAWLW